MCENSLNQMEREELPDMLTVKDIQKIMRVSINVAYGLIHSKAFPVIKIGNFYRIPKDSFYTWLTQSHTVIL